MSKMSTKPLRFTDYQVSKTTGFMLEDPLEELPPYFETWNQMAKLTPELVDKHELRDKVDQMPLLDDSRLNGNRELRLAHLQLSTIGTGYVWQNGDDDAAKRIPASLAVPWWNISEKLGMKPIICHHDLSLANWKLIDPQKSVTLENIRCIYLIPGVKACSWFFVVAAVVELTFVKAFREIESALEGINTGDEFTVTRSLEKITETIGEMKTVLSHMHDKLEPEPFYNVMRPFLAGWGGEGSPLPDGLIYEGISEEPKKMFGGSGGQSPSFQLLDSFLGIEHKPARQEFLKTMREYMPTPHRQLLEDMSARAVKMRDIALTTENSEMKDAFNACLDAFVKYRSYHIQLVTKYIVVTAGKQERNRDWVTGGKGVMPFLKDLRNTIKDHMLTEVPTK